MNPDPLHWECRVLATGSPSHFFRRRLSAFRESKARFTVSLNFLSSQGARADLKVFPVVVTKGVGVKGERKTRERGQTIKATTESLFIWPSGLQLVSRQLSPESHEPRLRSSGKVTPPMAEAGPRLFRCIAWLCVAILRIIPGY